MASLLTVLALGLLGLMAAAELCGWAEHAAKTLVMRAARRWSISCDAYDQPVDCSRCRRDHSTANSRRGLVRPPGDARILGAPQSMVVAIIALHRGRLRRRIVHRSPPLAPLGL
jgi:hypothetical protein